MSDTGVLIIDDVEAALAKMTVLGRSVAMEPAMTIRDEVIRFAALQKWIVQPYGAYRDWARGLIQRHEQTWFVLDPLLDAADLRGVRAVRASRTPDGFNTYVEFAQQLGVTEQRDVGLVDDAAASGRTLRDVGHWLAERGLLVSRFAVCASTREARERLAKQTPRAAWFDFLRGDWRIMHLRDGCPHLPYTGRRTNHDTVLNCDGTGVQVRTPATHVPYGIWQTLYAIPRIKAAVMTGRSSIVATLRSHVGREAVVGDLARLGDNVPALVSDRRALSSQTSLSSLILGE